MSNVGKQHTNLKVQYENHKDSIIPSNISEIEL